MVDVRATQVVDLVVVVVVDDFCVNTISLAC